MPDPTEDIPPIYANVVRISPGPFDLVLDFGYRSPEQLANQATRGSIEYPIVARVAMSLSHAKTMIPLLVEAVAKYEEQFGKIPAPGFDEGTTPGG